jgi:hypothetical protein
LQKRALLNALSKPEDAVAGTAQPGKYWPEWEKRPSHRIIDQQQFVPAFCHGSVNTQYARPFSDLRDDVRVD